MRLFTRTVLAAAAFTLLADIAAGQGVRETGRVSRDWSEACEPDRTGRELCFVYQNVFLNGNRVAYVAIGYKPGVRGPVLVVNLPLGILLADGLRVETDRGVDGWTPFRSCHQRGCDAQLEIEPKLLRAMKEGSDAFLVFKGIQEQQIRLPVSLRGFTAGLGGLSR